MLHTSLSQGWPNSLTTARRQKKNGNRAISLLGKQNATNKHQLFKILNRIPSQGNDSIMDN